MILCIDRVLSDPMVTRLRSALETIEFRDGKETAGWHARTVKHNQQADGRDPGLAELKETIGDTLARHTLFQIAARPRRMKPVMFSRYQRGMQYGSHVDDAVMPSPQGPMRTDLSFTIFLTPPEEYDGGELVTDTTVGEQSYKLAAGSMILYPSSTLHRVAEVTRGERLAAVGWLQSQVRDPGQREILFDLDTARRRLFEEHGKTDTFDALSKSLANLQRMWAEV
ncbi:Fe2+-dependent dioxygenase [Halomonas sp. V046]|uniref:Fe2+-dependent dioxygenase n=1 Tax=Halomonas sp. V046 TaxID=3459611 RepID=UPI00404506C2